MYKKEIALNNARRVDQRHRRQTEDAELAEGRARTNQPLPTVIRRLDAARPHNIQRRRRPAAAHDDGARSPKPWSLSFEWSPLPEIDLSTRDTRGGRLSDRYDACVRPPPLEAAYDAADGCHTKPTKANEPGFSRSANRSYRHISDGYGSWKGISTRGLARRAEKDLAKLLSFASRCARAPRTPPRATKGLRARFSCLVHRRATKGLRRARPS